MKFVNAASVLLLAASAAGFTISGPNTFVSSRQVRSLAPLPLKMSETADVPVAEKKAETFEFQAEVGRVMDIIINSLYSDKDIFLRELVSNAADACDKKRFLTVTADSDTVDVSPPQIRVKADPENQLIIIEDSGVGMTRDELINNLGRIAQSGTKNFMDALGGAGSDVNLIGQFGKFHLSSFSLFTCMCRSDCSLRYYSDH